MNCILGFSQEQKKDIEKSITNVQAGILGFWVNNETKVAPKTALRSEIGLGFGISYSHYNSQVSWAFAPLLRVEPKYYYNIDRRVAKGKSIDNNSGNYFSLSATYIPDWFVISNVKNLNVIPSISFIPNYGLRRNINAHLNYELAFGIGYRYLFLKQGGYGKNEGEVTPNLTFRLGYTF